MSAPSPPRGWERALRTALEPGIVREDIVGSLAEEYADLARRAGAPAARRWYRRQVAGIVVRAAGRRLTGRSGRRRVEGSTLADVRFAWRAMRRAPGPHLVAIVTIALGVGANAAIFSVVRGVLLAPLPYADADRLVRVWPEKRWSPTMFEEVRDGTSSFDALAATDGRAFILLGEGEPEVHGFLAVSASYFDLYPARPHLGRALVRSDEVDAEGPVVVLTWGFWTSRFGADPDIVGRSVRLSGSGATERTVVGVMPEGYRGWPESRTGWVPFVTAEDAPGFQGAYGSSVVGRLAPGATQTAAIEEMRRLIPDMSTRHATQFREIRFSPVDVVPLKEAIVRDARRALTVLFAAVGFVLLIACTNVANLLLARASARRREMGLRLALGAERARLVRLMLTESVLLGVTGGVAGAALAFGLLPALRGPLGRYLPRVEQVVLDVPVLLYAIAISALAGLLFGAVPALRSGGEDPASVLGDQGRGASAGRRRSRLNGALVVLEVAMSFVLVVGAGLMLESLRALASVDPGFRTEGVLSMNLVLPAGRYDRPEARDALFRELLANVRGVPGVRTAAFVNGAPLSGTWSGIPYGVEGQESQDMRSQVGGYRLVSPDYFDLLEIPILSGRGFGATDVADGESVAIVNEAFAARHWPGESALDRGLVNPDGEVFARVVGVASDTRFAGLDDPPVATMYFPAAQRGWSAYDLLVRMDAPDPLTHVRDVVAGVHAADPDLPVRRTRALADVVAEATGDARFFTRLLGGFAGLALLLGLVGVYGVTAYAVSQRTREIGVRLALGATQPSVLGATIRSGMAPVVLGIAVGLAGAWAMSRSIAGLVYGVDVTDAGVYASVAAALGISGLVAILVPARRATRVDPMAALREE